MNKRKTRQIGKDILAEPRRFNMQWWLQRMANADDARNANHSLAALPPCGTVACFAGEWALRYGKIKPNRESTAYLPSGRVIAHACAEDLDLPNEALFYEDRWPYDLRKGLRRFKAGTKRYARYFVEKVLEDYIKTNGWQNKPAP